MRPLLVNPPAAHPVTVDELKQDLSIGFADDDARLDACIAAAVGHLDGYYGVLGRCLVNQTWQIKEDHWLPQYSFRIPDVSGVAINYLDADGVSQTVDPAFWQVLEETSGAVLRFRGYHAPALADQSDAIEIEVTAGFGAPGDVPAALRKAIRIHAAHLYDGKNEMGMHRALIAPYRWFVA